MLKGLMLAAAVAVMGTAGHAATIATGTATSRQDSIMFSAGVQPGVPLLVRITLDKPVYAIWGDYLVMYEWKTDTAEDDEYLHFQTHKVDDLTWELLITPPALSSYIIAVTDHGGAFTLAVDENTYQNFPISWTVDAWPQGVPEPATWAMLIAGFGLVGVTARRRSSCRPFRQLLDQQ